MGSSISAEREVYRTKDTVSPDNYELEVVSAGADIMIAAGMHSSIAGYDFVVLERHKVIALRDSLSAWLDN